MKDDIDNRIRFIFFFRYAKRDLFENSADAITCEDDHTQVNEEKGYRKFGGDMPANMQVTAKQIRYNGTIGFEYDLNFK